MLIIVKEFNTMILLKILIILIIFFSIEALVYFITEYDKLPKFLMHKPWFCRVCCQFWVQLGILAVFYLQTHWLIPSIFWLVITILETIALKYDEKQKTIIP